MKNALVALLVLASASPALAISRHNTQGMACESIRNVLRNEGASVLRYPSPRKPGITLYDRYVRSDAFCDMNEYADRAYVPAKDTPRCPVLQCKPLPTPGDGWPTGIIRHQRL